jgi:hypothetical protein
VCRQSQGFALRSQVKSIDFFLMPFLAYFRQGTKAYPITSTDWQIALVNFLRFVLIDQSYCAQSVRSRIVSWRSAMSTFKFFIDEEIIPCDVQVPGIHFRTEVLAVSKSPLLGRSTQKVGRATSIQKLLVDVGWAEADADYLSSIERECQRKITALRAVCLKHWAAMKADHPTGSALAMQVPATEIDECLRENRFRKRVPGTNNSRGYAHLTSPVMPEGHLWASCADTAFAIVRLNNQFTLEKSVFLLVYFPRIDTNDQS